MLPDHPQEAYRPDKPRGRPGVEPSGLPPEGYVASDCLVAWLQFRNYLFSISFTPGRTVHLGTKSRVMSTSCPRTFLIQSGEFHFGSLLMYHGRASLPHFVISLFFNGRAGGGGKVSDLDFGRIEPLCCFDHRFERDRVGTAWA